MSQSKSVIFAKGKLFELVHTTQPDGRVFEVARRAPGVRLIIANDQGHILLTKEFRKELNSYDYRLPGGKVFDSLEEYEKFRNSDQDILDPATKKAQEEALEEAGININALKLFKRSILGATVEWDLFVFESRDWTLAESGQRLEDGEEIEADTWVTFDEAEKLALSGEMHEERIALILLQWISEQRSQIQ